MDMSFNASVSGARTASQRHDITANDVANINTGGYEQKVPHQSDTADLNGTKLSSVSTEPNTSEELSNTDLAEETGEQIRNKNTYSANLSVIKTEDEMLGTLLDITG